MEFFRIRRTIHFMRFDKIFNTISFISFLIAVFLLFTRGLAFSIEFTGGTVMEVTYPQAAPTEQIREQIKTDLGLEAAVQNFGTARDVMIRLPIVEGETSGEQAKQVMAVLNKTEPDAKMTRVEFVGPQVGEELATDGLTALILVIIGIVTYLAFRFEWKFSVAAIIANLHDVVLVLGIFAFFQWEFSLPVLAAVLAVLGYSVNESVIIFDRVREHGYYGNDVSYGDHSLVDFGDDLGNVLLRRSCLALLCFGSDDRYLPGCVFIRVRGSCHCLVFGS